MFLTFFGIVTGPLNSPDYALFVSHQHPDGQQPRGTTAHCIVRCRLYVEHASWLACLRRRKYVKMRMICLRVGSQYAPREERGRKQTRTGERLSANKMGYSAHWMDWSRHHCEAEGRLGSLRPLFFLSPLFNAYTADATGIDLDSALD